MDHSHLKNCMSLSSAPNTSPYGTTSETAQLESYVSPDFGKYFRAAEVNSLSSVRWHMPQQLEGLAQQQVEEHGRLTGPFLASLTEPDVTFSLLATVPNGHPRASHGKGSGPNVDRKLVMTTILEGFHNAQEATETPRWRKRRWQQIGSVQPLRQDDMETIFEESWDLEQHHAEGSRGVRRGMLPQVRKVMALSDLLKIAPQSPWARPEKALEFSATERMASAVFTSSGSSKEPKGGYRNSHVSTDCHLEEVPRSSWTVQGHPAANQPLSKLPSHDRKYPILFGVALIPASR